MLKTTIAFITLIVINIFAGSNNGQLNDIFGLDKRVVVARNYNIENDSFSIVNYSMDTLRFDSLTYFYDTTRFSTWLLHFAEADSLMWDKGLFVENCSQYPISTTNMSSFYVLPNSTKCVRVIQLGREIICKGDMRKPANRPDTDTINLKITFHKGVEKDTLNVKGLYNWNLSDHIEQHSSFSAKNITVLPNPFNPTTRIIFTGFNKHDKVDLIIINSKGAVVNKLSTNTIGNRSVFNWNGKDMANQILPSGLYIARIYDENKALSCKLVLRK